ncbi:hypothetical protein O6H91_06G096300 [Diphasiastrum complanatum]|uniref:Uncharacterized protein n=1 Tax=Diphasiastrum complanatum TaxID=34168 RepID=A0ACC2DGM6_DIPCM|nr:hypothetical protein O6H91_06G096300 [Diphasiastrum complanatum]
MPAFHWFSWTKSLSCKTQRNQVHDPSTSSRSTTSSLLSGRYRRSGCSWSLSCLKDVVQGNTRVTHKSNSCSPRLQGSDDSLQEISSEALLTDSSCELRLASLGSLRSLKPGTGPKPSKESCLALKKTQSRKFSGCVDTTDILTRSSLSHVSQPHDDSKCRHSVLHQTVSELSVDDCSRSVVEIIFRSSWMKNELPIEKIHRILKVHNTPRTLSKFEEYRDLVKDKASNNMPSKHPRCIVDGNELLRFHSTTMACSLGAQTSCCLCTLHNCEVCYILRSGFSADLNGHGIYTTATSGKAHDSASKKRSYGQKGGKLAMLVCRVIAGSIYKTSDYLEHLIPPSGYDSISGETYTHSIVDDLVVYNSEAVLPCFMVVYNC